MKRLKNSDRPAQRPGSFWLAGMLIGAAIMTMATQAVALGAGAAIRDVTLRGS